MQPHTKEQLVLVYNIGNSKVNRTKYDDKRLDDAIKHGDHKHQDRLRIHDTIIDHRRCIEFCEICLGMFNK
jgi:hypothetical protein